MLQNPHVLLTFQKIDNPLHLRRRTTSEHPKVVREPLVFKHFDFKCALHHNGVHCFDIATSKSGLTLRCFVHFDFKMCFARPNGVQSSDIATSKRDLTLRCFEGEQYRCTAAKMRPTNICQTVYKCKTKAENFQSHR